MLFLKKEKLLLLVNPTNYAAKIFIVIYILSTSTIFAQQVEQFTIVRENAVSLNPAYTGAQGYMHGNATYRNQYSKITDAPYTAFANFEYQFQEKNFGLGGMFVHDQTGPTGRTGGTIMASYQLRLNQHETMNLDHEWFNTKQTHMLTFGLALSVVQYRLNGAKLIPEQNADPELFNTPASIVFPDASIGVHYQRGETFFADISCPQLLGLNTKYKGAGKTSNIRKVQHLNILLGGRIKMGYEKKYSIDPVLAFRWANNSPPQADVGFRFTALDSYWIGANYRTLNAVIFEAGIEIKKYVRLCYAYDLQITKYRNDIGSTHEVNVSFTLAGKPNRY